MLKIFALIPKIFDRFLFSKNVKLIYEGEKR